MKQLTFLLVCLLIATPVFAKTEVRTYEVPDVKNDFCGVHIGFQYCKCAFHNQYCDSAGLGQRDSYHYVLDAFREWNRVKIQTMGEQCIAQNGNWNTNNWSCTYDVVDPALLECQAVLKDFDNNWEKYSDFDDRLGGDVSYEVKTFNETLDDIGHLIAEAHEIEYQMTLEIEVRKEIKAYKRALVLNIRQNVTKAIFRLSWVTFDAIKSGYGAKGSIKMLVGADPASTVQQTGAVLKLVQAQIPKTATNVSFDTSTTIGKIKSAAWNATLETMESAGDPVAVATQVTKDARSAAVGGPDLSDEEVAVLRDQHLSNEAADVAIADSYAASAQLRAELAAQKALISEQYQKLENLKLQEYQRVKAGVEDECKTIAEKNK